MSEQRSGPLPPYGVPIHEAIARGDLAEMKELSASVRPALDALDAAIAKADGSQPRSVKPYGPPIWAAIERGDPAELKAVAGAARAALYGVSFQPVSDDNAGEVREALAALEKKIAELDR